ncbi:MAG: YbaB/EbfC family nucleoid-associated protein [Dethiobacteria bacterium]|jgi:DNA-binding YbaB/EbfC family protein|nr:YbaB/EbfC family nucleoid-associated protein [Bacillota bacterium]HPT33157.1 YbaB/EbfC family nucleoid-associated protein [Bacillota bacterium]HPZ65260.1 YbaB/EbfC family nucleoid-associated protein [Bacillota bacterium]HQD05584.1 YbaB/EbfC family nucleoid-associated protein [Bacillota bacterium]
MKGGMGMGNMGKMMKQLQKMQSQMAKVQEEIAEKVVEGSSGGGAVRVEVNGQKELLSVKIDEEVLSQDNREMLEDLILTAVNEALRKVDEMIAAEMQKVAGSVKLPPGLF